MRVRRSQRRALSARSPSGLPTYRRIFLIALAGTLGLAASASLAQMPEESHANRALPAVSLPDHIKPPKIDGDLSDPAWQHGAKAITFYDSQTGKAVADQTEAWLLYNKEALYVAFYCHDSEPNGIVGRETVRDADMSNDDTVRITLDPFLTRKFEEYSVFVVNPIGTRRTFMGGGRAGKVEWQGDWEAAAKRVADGWVAELRIPWSILSYPRNKSLMTMGLNFRRQHARTKIESYWCDLGPQRFNDRDGQWTGLQAPVQSWKPRFSLLPYLLPTGQITGGSSQVRAGLDARFQPTPEMTAVATLNPDFASVEGVVESVGFTRSERFVPDRRPFFLEGQNYLNLGQGYEIGTLFDSTRIAKVDTGIKLYGKLTPQMTLGMMGTLAVGNQSNLVTQLNRQFSPTAGVNLLLLQHLAPGEDNTVFTFAPYARKGKWSLNGQFAQTAGPGAGGLAWTGAVNLEDKNLFTTLRYRHVGSAFVDRLGFIEFNDYRGFSSYTAWGTQWHHGALRGFDLEFSPTFDWHLDGKPFRRRADLFVSFETRSDYSFGFHVQGGKFDNDTDFTYGLDFGANVSNRFRQWRLSVTTGKVADRPFTSFGPRLSLRLFKKLDMSVGSYVENYNGVTHQHIVTLNYELNPYRSWGGRIVNENAGTNYYLFYRNAGRAGMETYFILGDPNAQKFVRRVMVKFVFAL